MTEPSVPALFAAVGATWPAAKIWMDGPWLLRDGAGGGKRVSAATAEGAISSEDIAWLEDSGNALAMVRPGEAELDAALESRDWNRLDPTRIMVARTSHFTAPPRLSAFAHWPPLAITSQLWTDGGIGPDRRAVMDRVLGPKAAILGRTEDRAAGVAFTAIHEGIAMVHAAEVVPRLRRRKVAAYMMGAAAIWAQDHHAPWLVVLVTEANTGARALYHSLGLRDVGYYHYRQKAPQRV